MQSGGHRAVVVGEDVVADAVRAGVGQEIDMAVLEKDILALPGVVQTLMAGLIFAGASAMRAKVVRPRFLVGSITPWSRYPMQ